MAEVRDRAPGFGAELLDGLLRDAYVEGYRLGCREEREAAPAEWQETVRRAQQAAARMLIEWLSVNVIRTVKMAEERLDGLLGPGSRLSNAQREEFEAVAGQLNRAIRTYDEKAKKLNQTGPFHREQGDGS